jgi:hypothetical protein
MNRFASTLLAFALLFLSPATEAQPGKVGTPVRADFIKHATTLIERAYLFPDKGKRVAEDLHFSVKSIADHAAKNEVEAFLEARRASEDALRSEFNGFKGVSNLGEGVGYLAFSVFRDRGREDLDTVLRLLRHADAIVMDLRGHRLRIHFVGQTQ